MYTSMCLCAFGYVQVHLHVHTSDDVHGRVHVGEDETAYVCVHVFLNAYARCTSICLLMSTVHVFLCVRLCMFMRSLGLQKRVGQINYFCVMLAFFCMLVLRFFACGLGVAFFFVCFFFAFSLRCFCMFFVCGCFCVFCCCFSSFLLKY